MSNKEPPTDSCMPKYLAMQAKIIEQRYKFLQSLIELCKPLDEQAKYILTQEIRQVPIEFTYEPKTIAGERAMEQYKNALALYQCIYNRLKLISKNKV